MSNEPIETLGDALPREIARVRAILPEYQSIPAGFFAARLIEIDLHAAEKAIAEQDIVAMLTAYEALKGIKE